MSHPIECPSGMTGEIRRFKTRDYDLFSDRALADQKGPAVSAAVCRQLWEQTTDAGLYDIKGDGHPDWAGKVLEHDRFYILMQARMMGPRGVKYDANFACDDVYCDERIPWTVDLRDLPVRPITDEAAATFAAGNRFELTLPRCKRSVAFQLPTYDVQKRIELATKTHGKCISALYTGKIEEVEGLVARSQIFEFVQDLDAEDYEALDEAIDESDFGVDTNIEIMCPECRKRQDHDLIWGADFFLPSAGARKRKRAARQEEHG